VPTRNEKQFQSEYLIATANFNDFQNWVQNGNIMLFTMPNSDAKESHFDSQTEERRC